MEGFYLEIHDEVLIKIHKQDIQNGVVSLPAGIKRIAFLALSNCNIVTSLIIPEGVQFIDHGAFCLNDSLASVKFPHTIKSIGKEAFRGCRSLQSIMLPEGLEVLGLGVFSSCNNLESISLPSTLKVFPERLVFGCNRLKSIDFPEHLETVEKNFLSGWYGTVSLKIQGEIQEAIAFLRGFMLVENHWRETPYDIYFAELYHTMKFGRWKTQQGCGCAGRIGQKPLVTQPRKLSQNSRN